MILTMRGGTPSPEPDVAELTAQLPAGVMGLHLQPEEASAANFCSQPGATHRQTPKHNTDYSEMGAGPVVEKLLWTGLVTCW